MIKDRPILKQKLSNSFVILMNKYSIKLYAYLKINMRDYNILTFFQMKALNYLRISLTNTLYAKKGSVL